MSLLILVGLVKKIMVRKVKQTSTQRAFPPIIVSEGHLYIVVSGDLCITKFRIVHWKHLSKE